MEKLLGYLFSKLLSFALLLAVLTALGLSIQHLRPGSASLLLAGQQSSAAELQKLRQQTGEGEPLFRQFLSLYVSYLQLDAGLSLRQQPVMPLIRSAFVYTLILSLLAAGFALLYGLLSGVVGFQFVFLRGFLLRLNYFLLSNPVFIVALVLLWAFALYFCWLPPGGVAGAGWYLLPAMAMGLKSGSRVALFADEFMAREMIRPYVKTARALGYRQWRIIMVFVLANLFLPLLSFWLLEFAGYLAGAAIVESIFAIPGLGSLLLHALYQYDTRLLMGILVFTSFLIFLLGLLHDFLDHFARRFSPQEEGKS